MSQLPSQNTNQTHVKLAFIDTLSTILQYRSIAAAICQSVPFNLQSLVSLTLLFPCVSIKAVL
jgi:hypothetical protein